MATGEATQTPALDLDLEWVVSDDLVDDLVGERIAGYDVLELIGHGGFGDVYRAEHPVIKSAVAIKVLHPDVARCQNLVRRFVLEAKAANQIQSPHIVPVSYFGKLADGRPFTVMEFLSGSSLDTLIHEQAPMSLEHVAALVSQIAQGMKTAHAAQIIHRDLKPANLFVEPHAHHKFGLVRILDFGVAKFVPNENEHTLTQHVGPMGTPRYASPEQLVGSKVGAACDMYALGTMAYEMLTGCTPFTGEAIHMISEKSLQEAPSLHELRPDLPANVCNQIMRMIKRLPEERLHDMEQVADFFGSPQRWGETYRTRQVRRVSIVALGVCLLVGLGMWALKKISVPEEVRPMPPTQIEQVRVGPISVPAPVMQTEAVTSQHVKKIKPTKKILQPAVAVETKQEAPVAASENSDHEGLINPLMED